MSLSLDQQRELYTIEKQLSIQPEQLASYKSEVERLLVYMPKEEARIAEFQSLVDSLNNKVEEGKLKFKSSLLIPSLKEFALNNIYASVIGATDLEGLTFQSQTGRFSVQNSIIEQFGSLGNQLATSQQKVNQLEQSIKLLEAQYNVYKEFNQ